MKNKEKDLEQSKESQELINKLREYFDLCRSSYSKIHQKMKVLDMVDSADLWKALNAKFPKYQILPDTNFISYVKSNLVASIYTICKSAELQPTSEDDKELVLNLNVAMDRVWNTSKVGYYQFLAGDRAALMNIGITQVGWDDDVHIKNRGTITKGNITLENVSPIEFMRDPSAKDLDSAAYCMRYTKYHKNIIKANKAYAEEFKKYLFKEQAASTPLSIPELNERDVNKTDKDYYTIVIFWVRNSDGTVDEVHTVNCEHILCHRKDIKPSKFPFAILHCNPPGNKLVGVSEPMKVFANNVAYNIMDSITLTAEYKNQRPPKFISAQSGLNIHSFARHGDEADRTFIVNGMAKDAVYYHQFPQPSAAVPQLQTRLQYAIENVSGVDSKYTGRDTGSIITTGGIEEMLNRATVVDTPKIMMYEEYTKQLTELIVYNFLEFAPKRTFFYKKPNSNNWMTTEVDFPNIDTDSVFDYQLDVSSEMPDTKQRRAQTANMLMEKQMQYRKEGGSGVELITEEEWLMMQDLPNKEFMLERMGVQRMTSAVEEVSQVLFQYADLVQNGMDPNEAILATANTMQQGRNGMPPEVGPIPGAVPEGMLPPEEAPMPMGGGMPMMGGNMPPMM